MLVPCQNIVIALAISVLSFQVSMLFKQSDNVLIDQEYNLTLSTPSPPSQAVITHTEITTEIVNKQHPMNVTCLNLIVSTHLKNP